MRVQWQRFVEGLAPSASLREEILESWGRSRSAGVDPWRRELADRRVTEEELARRLAQHRSLTEVARPHLEWISALHGDVAHVAFLTDRDGVILHAVGPDDVALQLGGFAPGHDWSEAARGTNGAGTALAIGVPVSVTGAEHFARAWHGWTCAGAPVRSAEGALLGAAVLAVARVPDAPDRLTTMAHVAFAIERALREAQAREATGRMVGGVAHDFNNLLTVIGSYAQMALDAAPAGTTLAADLREVQGASARAAALARRLLECGREADPGGGAAPSC